MEVITGIDVGTTKRKEEEENLEVEEMDKETKLNNKDEELEEEEINKEEEEK